HHGTIHEHMCGSIFRRVGISKLYGVGACLADAQRPFNAGSGEVVRIKITQAREASICRLHRAVHLAMPEPTLFDQYCRGVRATSTARAADIATCTIRASRSIAHTAQARPPLTAVDSTATAVLWIGLVIDTTARAIRPRVVRARCLTGTGRADLSGSTSDLTCPAIVSVAL